jgi:hypothetical protein
MIIANRMGSPLGEKKLKHKPKILAARFTRFSPDRF